MNYIKHLTAIYEIFWFDDRLNPPHISLYMALFKYWNLNHFNNPVSISRGEVMRSSKIGSASTYHKYIKELDQWKYIKYIPSFNPYKGSKIIMYEQGHISDLKPDNKHSYREQVMVRLHSSAEQVQECYRSDNEQVQECYRSDNGQDLVSYKTYINNKHIKHKTLFIDQKKIKKYFLEKKCSVVEAEKFFNYYESIGWKIGGKIQVKNWKAVARNWIIKSEEIKKEKTKNAHDQKSSRLHVKNEKDYGLPL